MKYLVGKGADVNVSYLLEFIYEASEIRSQDNSNHFSQMSCMTRFFVQLADKWIESILIAEWVSRWQVKRCVKCKENIYGKKENISVLLHWFDSSTPITQNLHFISHARPFDLWKETYTPICCQSHFQFSSQFKWATIRLIYPLVKEKQEN